VPAVKILAFVVVLRAWVAMPSTVLKGNDQHRGLAAIASVGALANLLLSIPLVKSWGITGVALGTAIPVTVMSAGVIFPRACRVVGLEVARGYRLIVWPAVWPAVLVVTALSMTRQFIPPHLMFVLMHMAGGAVLYAALFLRFGLSRGERQSMTAAVHRLWRGHDDAGLAVA
jgi:O-antigen/teichoic acid export membrane protein